jgi:hypothetical protein
MDHIASLVSRSVGLRQGLIAHGWDCLHWHAESRTRSIPKQTRSTLFHDHLLHQPVDELGFALEPHRFLAAQLFAAPSRVPSAYLLIEPPLRLVRPPRRQEQTVPQHVSFSFKPPSRAPMRYDACL